MAIGEVAASQPAALLEGANVNPLLGNLLKTHVALGKEMRSVPTGEEESRDRQTRLSDFADVVKAILG